jgi:hypothetical protein
MSADGRQKQKDRLNHRRKSLWVTMGISTSDKWPNATSGRESAPLRSFDAIAFTGTILLRHLAQGHNAVELPVTDERR